MEDESLWKEVIKNKYGGVGGRWLPVMEGSGKDSYVWSDILSVLRANAELFEFFKSNCKLVIGNGCRIHFWHDKWMSNVQLKVEFPRLFRLSVDKEGNLSSFMQRRDISGNWRFMFSRSLLAWEEEEVQRLQELIRDAPRINEELPDSVRWTASPSGQFTVASMRKWYEVNQGPKLQVPNLLWRGVAPPKAQFLSWLAWRGRVKTISLLQRFRALSSNVENLCLFCKLEPESVDHLFLQCSEIWKVWSSMLQWWGVSWVIPATVDGVLLWWLGTKCKKSVMRIWRLVPIAMLWSVWRLRNECVFKGNQPNMEELGEIVKVRVGLWAKSGLPEFHYSVHDVVANLNQVTCCL